MGVRERLVGRLGEGFPEYMVSFPPGWEFILDRLDKDLTAIYPDYKLGQVKEKFGGLRLYIVDLPESLFDDVYSRIKEASRESYETCEGCGTKEGVTTEGEGWVETLCPTCRTA